MLNRSHVLILCSIKETLSFFELYVLLVPTQNLRHLEFLWLIALNNSKLIGYFGSFLYSIVLKRSHILILCSIKETLSFFELYVSLVQTQNQDLSNFSMSLDFE